MEIYKNRDVPVPNTRNIDMVIHSLYIFSKDTNDNIHISYQIYLILLFNLLEETDPNITNKIFNDPNVTYDFDGKSVILYGITGTPSNILINGFYILYDYLLQKRSIIVDPIIDLNIILIALLYFNYEKIISFDNDIQLIHSIVINLQNKIKTDMEYFLLNYKTKADSEKFNKIYLIFNRDWFDNLISTSRTELDRLKNIEFYIKNPDRFENEQSNIYNMSSQNQLLKLMAMNIDIYAPWQYKPSYIEKINNIELKLVHIRDTIFRIRPIRLLEFNTYYYNSFSLYFPHLVQIYGTKYSKVIDKLDGNYLLGQYDEPIQPVESVKLGINNKYLKYNNILSYKKNLREWISILKS